MAKVRVGLVGCGFVAELHMYAYKRVSGIDAVVTAVVARGDHVLDFAKKHQFARPIAISAICSPTGKSTLSIYAHRPFAQRRRWASAMRALPSAVRGPVESPPWKRQRTLLGSTRTAVTRRDCLIAAFKWQHESPARRTGFAERQRCRAASEHGQRQQVVGRRVDDALDLNGERFERAALLGIEFMPIIGATNSADGVTEASLSVIARHPCPAHERDGWCAGNEQPAFMTLSTLQPHHDGRGKLQVQPGPQCPVSDGQPEKGDGDSIEIRIRDNGTSIPPEVKEKLFNPFFTTKPAGEGTGLGLSISHDIIVKQHGGSIEVDTQPGVFTEFRIVLPRAGAALISRENAREPTHTRGR